MNIFLISLFDPTPMDEPIYPRFIAIAKSAIRRGHKVTHFTSTFRHNPKSHRFEDSTVIQESEDYEIVYTKSRGYKNNRMPLRYMAHDDYAGKLIAELKRRPKPDVIFISMPPLSTISRVTKWGKANDVPVIVDIIDPWPDSFIKNFPRKFKKLGEVLISPFYSKLRNSLSRSSAITAISEGYLKWASEYHSADKKTKSFFLAIEFDEVQEKLERLSEGIIKDDTLRLIYAGSLGSSYDIPTILKSAAYFDQNYPGKTHFVITGSGPQTKEIDEVKDKLKNLDYLGRVSSDELLRQYGIADLGLIQHKNSLTQTITYKFFNYMSAGLPLLNSLQSEMASLIDEYKLGLNNKERNADQLIENIKSYLGSPELLHQHRKNVLDYARKFGNGEVVYDNLVKFIEEVSNKTNL